MEVIDLYLFPITTLDEFHTFTLWTIRAASQSPHQLRPSSTTRSLFPHINPIDPNPNRDQDRCTASQFNTLFFCCWNRIFTLDLNIFAARQIPIFYRRDGVTANMLREVAWGRLEYRRLHPGLDLHEDTIMEIIDAVLAGGVMDFRDERRGRVRRRERGENGG